jgi:hypothetical protein
VLSIPRGPKISAASASHELLLEEFVSITGSQGYTWNSYKGEKGDFSDRLTWPELERMLRQVDEKLKSDTP